MNKLVLGPNIANPDETYQCLVDAYEDLDATECGRFNIRLILVLANHIGDEEIIRAAINVALHPNARLGA